MADERMEQAIVSEVLCTKSDAKITILQVPDRPGVAGKIFRALADSGVVVDMIVQNVSATGSTGVGHTDISLTVPRDQADLAALSLAQILDEVEATGWYVDNHSGRVALVGAGMKTHPQIVARVFDTLATAGINIEMISTSTIQVACVVAEDDVDRAAGLLRSAFGLDA